MILVVGSTGLLGSEICRQLAAQSKPVRALVRSSGDPSKAESLHQLGVAVVAGDLRDPASLDAACQGCDTVISTASAMPFSFQPDNTLKSVDEEGQRRLIDAARAAAVQHFVYVSFSGNIEGDFPLCHAKRATERYLRQSGLPSTILRPSYFMEVWLGPMPGFDAANASARIYGSGDQKLSWISLRDVARFAVACLDHPAARNATLELGGPEALSPHDVVRIFEDVTGRPFDLQYVPVAMLEAQQAAAPDPFQQSFAGLARAYARGDLIPMEETLRAFPMHMTTVRSYAEHTLARQP